jgi:hypothetical protein
MTLGLASISAWALALSCAPACVACVQLAPGGALAVEQRFPAGGLRPARQLLGRDALLLEIVELVFDAVSVSQVRAFLTVSQLGMP